jgi:uncharacterized membrane protein
MNIPENQIVSITDFLKNYKKYDKQIQEDGTIIIFKNNKPSKVIMRHDIYVKIINTLELDDLNIVNNSPLKKWETSCIKR